MIELASDLHRIRRYAARAAHRCRVELDDLVSETALEILDRCRRQPDLRVAERAMLFHATNEALRRVIRRCHWPRRAFGFDLDALAAHPPDLADDGPPSRSCAGCGAEFAPLRSDSSYCTRLACGRARAAERQRRRKARAAAQSPTVNFPSA